MTIEERVEIGFRSVFRAITDILMAAILSLMWGWYIVPIGLPEITVIQALGILMIAYIIGLDYTKPTASEMLQALKKSGPSDNLYRCVTAIGILLIGFIMHFFI